MRRKSRAVPWLLVWLLMSAGLAWAQMEMRFVQVSATDTNTVTQFTMDVKALQVGNVGPNNAYINVSGTGIAATTGDKNILIRPGGFTVFTAPSGEKIGKVGTICATGETATVDLTATR